MVKILDKLDKIIDDADQASHYARDARNINESTIWWVFAVAIGFGFLIAFGITMIL